MGLNTQSRVPTILSAVLQADFPKTNDTLEAVPGLTITLPVGWHRITGRLNASSSPGGGAADLGGGTCTTTTAIGGFTGFSDGSNTGGAAEDREAGITVATPAASGFAMFDYTVLVTVAGTLSVQFAQQATHATATNLLVGATICSQSIPA